MNNSSDTDSVRARARGTFSKYPVLAGVLLTLFVALSVVIVGAELAAKRVIADAGTEQVREIDAMGTALRSASGLSLSGRDARDDIRTIAATVDFQSAVRRSLSSTDAMRIDIYAVDGQRVFSSSAAPPAPLDGQYAEAFAAARTGQSSSVLAREQSLTGLGRTTGALTTYRLIADAAGGPGPNGTPIMLAALTTDVTGDLRAAQTAVWWGAGTFGSGLLVLVLVVYWASSRSRMRLEAANAALMTQNMAVRESRERMLATADATKRAIAEELHGSVQTRLYAAWMKLNDIRSRVPADAPALGHDIGEIAAEIDRIREQDIRALSHRLHPGIVRVSASAGLRSLCDYYSTIAPLKLELGHGLSGIEPPGASVLRESTRLGIYRVAELALGNVAKHSRATECRVVFDYLQDRGELVLAITDNGLGFADRGRAAGLGLVTMEDYADSLGGSLEIKSAEGAGTTVTLRVPHSVSGEAAAVTRQSAGDVSRLGAVAPAAGG
jgi:signal transduction histidine kinase